MDRIASAVIIVALIGGIAHQLFVAPRCTLGGRGFDIAGSVLLAGCAPAEQSTVGR